MAADITPEDIKRIRKSYGLSQKAFARILGIGDASIVRYENGQKPTRAIANLIRAAENKQFMLGCLERAADELTERQTDEISRLIYAEVGFDEQGEVNMMNEVYELTLAMEVLNEQAAGIIADLIKMKQAALREGDSVKALIYQDVLDQISLAKYGILDCTDLNEVAEQRGKILAMRDLAAKLNIKAA